MGSETIRRRDSKLLQPTSCQSAGTNACALLCLKLVLVQIHRVFDGGVRAAFLLLGVRDAELRHACVHHQECQIPAAALATAAAAAPTAAAAPDA